MDLSTNHNVATSIAHAESGGEILGQPVARIKSEDLMQTAREIEIDHGGRIYRLRLTQLNKLILTA